jgi:broad specificity phosphatase PhoE
MVTTIYLVRHGETDWNAGGRCQGTTDVPMNAAGVAQVEALANELAHVVFDAAYTSPLTRTRETAAAILRRQRLRAMPIPELIELSYGELQGTTSDSWEPSFASAWLSDPWSIAFPGGESLAMVRDRAVPVLQRIVAMHPGETVLISGHGHLNRVLALHALARPDHEFWKLEQANASALVLQFPAGAARR